MALPTVPSRDMSGVPANLAEVLAAMEEFRDRWATKHFKTHRAPHLIPEYPMIDALPASRAAIANGDYSAILRTLQGYDGHGIVPRPYGHSLPRILCCIANGEALQAALNDKLIPSAHLSGYLEFAAMSNNVHAATLLSAHFGHNDNALRELEPAFDVAKALDHREFLAFLTTIPCLEGNPAEDYAAIPTSAPHSLSAATLDHAVVTAVDMLRESVPATCDGIAAVKEYVHTHNIPEGIVRRMAETAARGLGAAAPFTAFVLHTVSPQPLLPFATLWRAVSDAEVCAHTYWRHKVIAKEPPLYPLLRAWDPCLPWTQAAADPTERAFFTTGTRDWKRSGPERGMFCTRDEFTTNFASLAGETFAPWFAEHGDDTIIAGGAVVACLDTCEGDGDVLDRTEYHGTDIDVFFYGLDEEGTTALVMKFYRHMVSQFGSKVLVLVNSRVMIFVLEHPRRRVQVSFGLWESAADVLSNADVDCCGVGYDGRDVLVTPRAYLSWQRRVNVPQQRLYEVRGSPTYEKRLLKYSERGFAVVDLGLPADGPVPVPDALPKGRTLLDACGLLWVHLTSMGFVRVRGKKCDGHELITTPDHGLDKVEAAVHAIDYVASDHYGQAESG